MAKGVITKSRLLSHIHRKMSSGRVGDQRREYSNTVSLITTEFPAGKARFGRGMAALCLFASITGLPRPRYVHQTGPSISLFNDFGS